MNLSSNESSETLEDRLSTELHAAANTIPISGDPTRAFVRSEQRRRRRTMINVAAGLVVVGGLTAGALNLWPRSGTDIMVASAGDLSPAGSADLPLTLEWRSADADVDWPSASFVGADGYRYALSTAPGARYGDLDENNRLRQAVYRTDDGEEWEPTEPAGVYLNGLGARNGVLYSVSTSSGADGSVISSVLSSVDDGAAWDAVDLPFDFAPVDDPNGLLHSGVSQPLSLAVGDSALIATSARYRWFDDVALALFLGLTPTESVSSELVEGADGTRVVLRDFEPCRRAWEAIEAEGEQGVNVADPDVCMNPPIVADVSIAELGIVGELHQQRSLLSVDGTTWGSAEVPGSQVWSVGGTFIAVDYEGSTSSYQRSTDGVTWTPMSIDDGGSIEIVGASGSSIVARGFSSDGAAQTLMLSSDGGQTWSDLAVGDLAPDVGPNAWISTAAAGDLGIVAVIGGDPEDPSASADWTIVTSRDGVRWTSQRADDVEGYVSGYASWAFVDDDRIGVVLSGAKRNDDGTVAAITLLGTPTR